MKTTSDSNKEYKKPTYTAMTEICKIISFPKLKEKVEAEFYVRRAFLLIEHLV